MWWVNKGITNKGGPYVLLVFVKGWRRVFPIPTIPPLTPRRIGHSFHRPLSLSANWVHPRDNVPRASASLRLEPSWRNPTPRKKTTPLARPASREARKNGIAPKRTREKFVMSHATGVFQRPMESERQIPSSNTTSASVAAGSGPSPEKVQKVDSWTTR